MKRIFTLPTILIMFTSCFSNSQTLNKYKSETLKIEQISKNIFMHISYLKTEAFGNVACNGMVYFNGNEAIIFDTPTDNDTSKELINWIEITQKKNIKAIVVTHFHNDCLGGLKQFHENGIISYANNLTIDLAKQNNLQVLPQMGFDNKMGIKIGKNSVFVEFFGQGHTSDNIVGYIPNENLLFGGCLIKSMDANKGFLGDANTTEWSKTVEKLKNRMPNLKIVIPGHGKYGGTELLDYTIRLFKEN